MKENDIVYLMEMLGNRDINGYGPDEKGRGTIKEEYHHLMRTYGHMLVKLLQPTIGAGKVHSNMAGPGISGEVIVRFDTLYIQFSQFSLASRRSAGYYRAEGDGVPFGYGTNHNIIIDMLRYPRELANVILINTESERRRIIEKRAFA